LSSDLDLLPERKAIRGFLHGSEVRLTGNFDDFVLT
jgi:hypothetical protein